jgi:hypothetical protein
VRKEGGKEGVEGRKEGRTLGSCSLLAVAFALRRGTFSFSQYKIFSQDIPVQNVQSARRVAQYKIIQSVRIFQYKIIQVSKDTPVQNIQSDGYSRTKCPVSKGGSVHNIQLVRIFQYPVQNVQSVRVSQYTIFSQYGYSST